LRFVARYSEGCFDQVGGGDNNERAASVQAVLIPTQSEVAAMEWCKDGIGSDTIDEALIVFAQVGCSADFLRGSMQCDAALCDAVECS